MAYHDREKKMYGGMGRKKKVYGGMEKNKRMQKNMGGVANAQPMYLEDMPKAMPN